MRLSCSKAREAPGYTRLRVSLKRYVAHRRMHKCNGAKSNPGRELNELPTLRSERGVRIRVDTILESTILHKFALRFFNTQQEQART